jgi:hypothetical protein
VTVTVNVEDGSRKANHIQTASLDHYKEPEKRRQFNSLNFFAIVYYEKLLEYDKLKSVMRDY